MDIGHAAHPINHNGALEGERLPVESLAADGVMAGWHITANMEHHQ